MKIYERHTQKSAIDFLNHIIRKFPFRIQQIRTDRGHEFQSQFHWHVEDLGIRHAYIKARTPQLNGEVERSHRSNQQEFYQLLSYKDDVDLEAKLAEWEAFYNFARPHGAHGGKYPMNPSGKNYNRGTKSPASECLLHRRKKEIAALELLVGFIKTELYAPKQFYQFTELLRWLAGLL